MLKKIKNKIDDILWSLKYELIGDTENHVSMLGGLKKAITVQNILMLAAAYAVIRLAINGIGSPVMWVILLTILVIVIQLYKSYKSGAWKNYQRTQKGYKLKNRRFYKKQKEVEDEKNKLQHKQADTGRDKEQENERLHTENPDAGIPPAA